MENHEFDITIGTDGKVKVIVKGSQGQRCLELADLVRDIVGSEDSRELTSEYHGPDGQVRIQSEVRARRKD